MANLWKRSRRALLPLAALGIVACQSDRTPVGPEKTAPSFVEVNGVKLVTILPGRRLSPAGGQDNRVDKKNGATLTSGDATLMVLPGSANNGRPTTITMEPEDASGYVQFKFGPDGTTFSPAATLTISAAKANIDPSLKGGLRVAGASDTADNWSVIGGTYDPVTDTVTVPISHFSRYALCIE